MFHRSERILGIVLEVVSVAVAVAVAVIRCRVRSRCPLADVKLAGLVLNLFVVRESIQACGAGWSNRKNELRLRTSLVRRANGRPGA